MDFSDEDFRQMLKDAFLKDPRNQPLYDLPSIQKIVPHTPNLESLYHVEASPLVSKLTFARDVKTGDLLDCQEAFYEDEGVEEDQNTATTSMSLLRKPVANAKDIAAFNATSLPFKPATVDRLCEREKYKLKGEDHDENKEQDQVDDGDPAEVLLDFDNLLKQAPGIDTFLEGIDVSPEARRLFSLTEESEQRFYEDLLKDFESANEPNHGEKSNTRNDDPSEDGSELLEKEVDIVLNIQDYSKEMKSTEWANVIDIKKTVPESEFNSQIPYPAFTYPFELDTFQKQAILCLERHQNVFVAAHTSAGKTVVAEYAIAMSIRRNLTRVVYTSPIKALSNQKFRDFRHVFGSDEVGLLTGDVQIKTDASCLIMTTEILLQMLYNGSELIRDLEWVIFDEVHYMNDKERGHVWEEVFILLPEHIKLVLLSATIGNAVQFAHWLGMVRKTRVNVIYTTQRPVPLEHYLYTGCNGKTINESFLFIDSCGKFSKSGYDKAVEAKKSREKDFQKNYGPMQRTGARNPQARRNTFITLIRFLEKSVDETGRNKLPVIIFTFSRIACYQNAGTLSVAMDLTTNEEKGQIQHMINKSLSKLKDVDRKIPQVLQVSTMLKNGFGVHHSGILPLLKEITEMLFDKGLVKVLFATETFAMGINMPARSVCFSGTKKHDGLEERDLLPAEYIQMAGRAGRRGKDKTGTVLILCQGDVPELSDLQRMTLGKVAPLQSQFRLTYSTILNILRSRERLPVESVMEKSFAEYEVQGKLEDTLKQQNVLRQKLKQMSEISCTVCSDVPEFVKTFLVLQRLRRELLTHLYAEGLQERKLGLFKDGRLLLFESETNPFVLGVALNVNIMPRRIASTISVLAVDPMKLVSCDGNLNELQRSFQQIELWQIHKIFKHNVQINGIKVSAEKSLPRHKQELTDDCLQKVFAFFLKMQHQLPICSIANLFMMSSLDCLKDFDLRDISHYLDGYTEFTSKTTKLLSYDCITCEKFLDHYFKAKEKVLLEDTLRMLELTFSKDSLRLMPEYKVCINVLKELKYINDQECLEMKGKVACLMSEHELVITEMLVENVLGDLLPEEIAALMSAFVFQEKQKQEQEHKKNKRNILLVEKSDEIKRIASKIGHTQKACGDMYLNVDDFVNELKFGLLEVVYHWAKGMSFAEVMKLTVVQEGVIVRCIQRLDELLKDVRGAAKLFGDQDLVRHFDDVSKCIRRDIVFAGSLYIEGDI